MPPPLHGFAAIPAAAGNQRAAPALGRQEFHGAAWLPQRCGGSRNGVYGQRFHAGAPLGMGRRPDLRLSRRRHQRHPGRARPRRGALRVRPGAARRGGGLHGLRPCQVHRPARRLHGDLRPGRDPPPEWPLRRQARPPAGGRDRRSAEARRAGRPLSAGGRPDLAVQGRGRRIRAHVQRPRADAPPGRPRAAHRHGRAHGDLHHRAGRRAGAGRGRKAPARARHHPFGAGLLAAAHRAGGRRSAARGRCAERRRAGRDAGRRRRARRDRRGDRRPPRPWARASPRRCSGAPRYPTICPSSPARSACSARGRAGT